MNRLGAIVVCLALAACTSSAPPERAANSAPPPATTSDSKPKPIASASRFVDRVWRVESSSAVAPGTLYTFLADGTLIVQSPQSMPSHGRWTYADGALIMIEEGISYPTDILALDDASFVIRSRNPGEPVDIKLVPAGADVPLPAPAAK